MRSLFQDHEASRNDFDVLLAILALVGAGILLCGLFLVLLSPDPMRIGFAQKVLLPVRTRALEWGVGVLLAILALVGARILVCGLVHIIADPMRIGLAQLGGTPVHLEQLHS